MFSDPLNLTEAENHDGSSSVLGFGEDTRLWREDFAERPEPVSSRTKRSRMEEMPQRSNAPKGREAGGNDEEFPDIDVLIPPSSILRAVARQPMKRALTAGAENPPSELTTDFSPLGNGAFSISSTNTASVGVEREIHQGNPGLPRLYSETTPWSPTNMSDFVTPSRKRKTPSSPSHGGEEFPVVEPAPLTQPSNKPKRTRRDIVLDSEDDLSALPTNQSVVGAGTNLDSGASHRTVGDDQCMEIDMSSPLDGTPSSALPSSGLPSVARQEKCTTDVSSDPVEEARSDVPEPSEASGYKEDTRGSHDPGTKRNRLVLDRFLKRPSVLESKMLYFNEQLCRNKEEYTKALRGNAPKEERARVRDARAALVRKQKSLDTIQADYKALRELESKREDILMEVGDAFADGLDTAEDETRIDELSEEIEAKEEALIRGLVATGLDEDLLKKPEESVAAPNSPAAPIVFATQPSHKVNLQALSNENPGMSEYTSQVVL